MGMLKNFFYKSINENTYPFGTKEYETSFCKERKITWK